MLNTLIFLLLLGGVARGGIFGRGTSKEDSAKAITAKHSDGHDRAAILDFSRSSEVFELGKMALQSLRSTDNTCSLEVTSKISESCTALETSSQRSNQQVELLHKQHAAMLAVCELQGGAAPWPYECEALQNSIPASRSDVDRCFTWMHADTNRWTSYVANRNSLRTICAVARGVIDRDHTINILNTFLSTAQSSTVQLEEMLQLFKVELENDRDVASEVRESQRMIVRNAQAIENRTREMVAVYQQDFQERLVVPFDGFLTGLAQSGDIVADIEKMLEGIRNQVAKNHAANTAIQEQSLQLVQHSMAGLHSSLASISGETAPQIVALLNNIVNYAADLEQRYQVLSIKSDENIEKANIQSQLLEQAASNTEKLNFRIQSIDQALLNILSRLTSFWEFIWSLVSQAVYCILVAASLIGAFLTLYYRFWKGMWVLSFFATLSLVTISGQAAVEQWSFYVSQDRIGEHQGIIAGCGLTISIVAFVWMFSCTPSVMPRLTDLRALFSRRFRARVQDSEECDTLSPLNCRSKTFTRQTPWKTGLGTRIDETHRFQRGSSMPPDAWT